MTDFVRKTGVSSSHFNDGSPRRTERALVWHIGLGFLLFLVVIPLTLASYNSYMSEEVMGFSQQVAATITIGCGCLLCVYFLKSALRLEKSTPMVRRILVIPAVLIFTTIIFGFVILLVVSLVGDVVVMATADKPHRLNTKIANVFHTRGCGAKVSFQVPATRREATYCGDHFASKPKVGDVLIVDEMISPYGSSIVRVRLGESADRKP